MVWMYFRADVVFDAEDDEAAREALKKSLVAMFDCFLEGKDPKINLRYHYPTRMMIRQYVESDESKIRNETVWCPRVLTEEEYSKQNIEKRNRK